MPAQDLGYETLQAIVDNASDGMFVTDASFRIEWVNAAACELLGRTVEQLLALRISDLLDPEELAKAPLRREELLAGRPTFTTRTFLTPDGDKRILEVSAKMIGGGRLLGLARDVTERHLTRQNIARSDAGFRAVIEQTPDAIIVRRGRTIVYANEACGRMLGWPSADHGVGRDILEAVVPADEQARVDARIRELQSGDKPLPYIETRLLRLDGSEVFVQVAATHVIFEGEPSVVVTARDLTAERRMSAQLAQADRLSSLGTLAAGIAHEINNPLTYVMLHLDSLVAGCLRQTPSCRHVDRLVEHASNASEGARRVARIVRDLRAFSRAGEEDRGPVDVHVPIDLALSTAGHELRHRARVERRFGVVPMVLASETRIAQIVLNLLVNAAHAIPEGRPDDHRVTVTTSAVAGEVHIAVSDTGSGITEENRRRIFEPFFTTKGVGEGTGLGLSICHGLVQALGGRIEVESSAGRGSTFVVVLPGLDSTPVAPTPPTPAPAVTSSVRIRILFVDDEPAIGVAVAGALEGTHDVVLATSAANARALLARDDRFDVVVCDLIMPGSSGAELHAWMRAAHPALAQRTLFVTGGRITGEPVEHDAIRSSPVLQKPFTLDALRAAVADLAQRPR